MPVVKTTVPARNWSSHKLNGEVVRFGPYDGTKSIPGCLGNFAPLLEDAIDAYAASRAITKTARLVAFPSYSREI